MVRRIILRPLRPSTPAKLLLLALLLFCLIFVPTWRSARPLTLNDGALAELWSIPRDDVATRYEAERLAELQRVQYDPIRAARSIRTRPSLPDGTPSLSPDHEAYTVRLEEFVERTFGNATAKRALDNAIGRIRRHAPSRATDVRRKLFSTDQLGESGVSDLFRLWNALLPIPFEAELANLLPETEWAEPARKPGPWKTVIADDGQINAQVSGWVGEGGKGHWAKTWRSLKAGKLRANIYRYMAMLFEGGIYADSDTAPIAHPYVWGLNAEDIVHPNLEAIEHILLHHEKGVDTTGRRVWERSVPEEPALSGTDGDNHEASVPNPAAVTNQSLPVGGEVEAAPSGSAVPLSHPESQHPLPVDTHAAPQRRGLAPQIGRRSPLLLLKGEAVPPDMATTILSPDISLVVAIDWDSAVSWDWRRWTTWTAFTSIFRRSRSGRSLVFSPSVLAAKPHHPIFVDTLATIVELLGDTDQEASQIPNLTGPGPFTDALLRYMLVRYGVTPDQLRNLKGPAKVGDILILQAGALSAPESALFQTILYVQSFFPNLPGSGVAQAVPGESLWYWGTGYRGVGSGGIQVVFHGTSQKWKDLQWTEEESQATEEES